MKVGAWWHSLHKKKLKITHIPILTVDCHSFPFLQFLVFFFPFRSGLTAFFLKLFGATVLTTVIMPMNVISPASDTRHRDRLKLRELERCDGRREEKQGWPYTRTGMEMAYTLETKRQGPLEERGGGRRDHYTFWRKSGRPKDEVCPGT